MLQLILIYQAVSTMATLLNATKTGALLNFLGGHHKIQLLLGWVDAAVKSEEIKCDYNAFKQMRRKKAIPRHKKSLFGVQVLIIRPPAETSSQPAGTPVAARTRHGVIGKAFQHISLDL